MKRVEKRYQCELKEGTNLLLDSLKKELSLYFNFKLKQFRTPSDVKGTVFEVRVWDELLAIPYGITRSYGEMATRLDKAGAARAVGRANGSNYLSIVIPCHRVIEVNGKLRGYGGKLWRKKYLLDLEAGIRPLIIPE